MIGVHTPEFSFARDRSQVKAAVGRLGIRWPVVLDNEQQIWQAYANRYWPTLYLIDPDGYIRYRHVGEGGYKQTEEAIQELLRMVQPQLELSPVMEPIRPEDAPGAVCFPTTPELHIDSFGNQQPMTTIPALFEFPQEFSEDRFYLQGWWKQEKDGLTMLSDEGSILLPYRAASVNGVFSASPDPVELNLELAEPRILEIHQDGEPLLKTNFTEDHFLSEGNARVRVDHARTYALVKNDDVRSRELTIKINGSGFTMYAFSFGSCIVPESFGEEPE